MTGRSIQLFSFDIEYLRNAALAWEVARHCPPQTVEQARQARIVRERAAADIIQAVYPALSAHIGAGVRLSETALVAVDWLSLLFVLTTRLPYLGHQTLMVSAGMGELMVLGARHPFAVTVREALIGDD